MPILPVIAGGQGAPGTEVEGDSIEGWMHMPDLCREAASSLHEAAAASTRDRAMIVTHCEAPSCRFEPDPAI